MGRTIIMSMLGRSAALGRIAACFIAGTLALALLAGAPARAQFVDQKTWGGVSGGSANAQTVTVPNWTRNLAGVPLRFLPGFANTGATQLNVSGLGLVNLLKRSPAGLVALSGAELSTTQVAEVIYDGTQYELLSPRGGKAPTVQVLLSGSSATYPTPTNPSPLYLIIKYCGGGGGGGSSGGAAGSAGADTSFGTGTALHGTGGGATGATGGVGGTGGVDLGTVVARIAGGGGQSGGGTAVANVNGLGGQGGDGVYGGAGAGTNAAVGKAAAANSCAGGGGGGGGSAGNGGAGGGAGEYAEALISSPSATYTYTVGSGGAGGAGGQAGGAGGSGRINVLEYYQ